MCASNFKMCTKTPKWTPEAKTTENEFNAYYIQGRNQMLKVKE